MNMTDTKALVEELRAKAWASTRYKTHHRSPANREDHVCSRAADLIEATMAEIRGAMSAPRVLDQAWRAIDALGGAYDGPTGDPLRRSYFDGYSKALNDAIGEVEKLGGRDASETQRSKP